MKWSAQLRYILTLMSPAQEALVRRGIQELVSGTGQPSNPGCESGFCVLASGLGRVPGLLVPIKGHLTLRVVRFG